MLKIPNGGRLPTVIRKVKFTYFVKSVTSPKMQLTECSFHTNSNVHSLLWLTKYGNFSKTSKLTSEVGRHPALRSLFTCYWNFSKVRGRKSQKLGLNERYKSTSHKISHLNKTFYKFKPVGICLDCTWEQIKICQRQCIHVLTISLVLKLIYITLAPVENTSSAVHSAAH